MKTTDAILKEGVYQRGWRDGAGNQPQDQQLLTGHETVSTARVRRWYSKGYEDGRMSRLAAFAKVHQAVHHPGLVGLHRGTCSPERLAIADQLAAGNRKIREMDWVVDMISADRAGALRSAKACLVENLDPRFMAGHWGIIRRWLRNLPIEDMSEGLLVHVLTLTDPWRQNLKSTRGRFAAELCRRGLEVPAFAQELVTQQHAATA